MQKIDPLIRTKLRLPFARPTLVPRPRLQTRIAEGLHLPLTLVIAPAGFGKTTLVVTCVGESEMPVAWLSLDRDDNQAGRFLNYLIAALQSADPCIGIEGAQLMAGIQTALPEAVLTSLINDLDAAGKELLLVLDDYQFISSQEVHAQVVFLLKHCPPTFHLLIASRSDPPIPMARLRARGQAVELRASDLSFSEPEAARFLNDVMGLHLDEWAVGILEEQTEGWVAGLQMAALSIRDRKDVRRFIEGFSGTNRHILDYLLEEILAGQAPEIQRFLLSTSILERLTAPLCDALLAEDESSVPVAEVGGLYAGLPAQQPSVSILEYLECENLFLVALDDKRTWFRYHHLFADLLRARLQQVQPGLVSHLHGRASTWLEENGLISEAIQHLFAIHADSRAAHLIEHYGPVRWAESDPSIIQMADSLPPGMLAERPKIGFYRAWLLIIQGNIEKALPLLVEMAVSPPVHGALRDQQTGADVKPGEQWIYTLVTLAFTFLGGPTGIYGFDHLPDIVVLDEIPADEPILRDAAHNLYGMILGRRGEIDRAAELATRCIQREKIPHATLTIPALVPFLARIYLVQGRLGAVASLSHEYLDPIKEKGIRFIYSAGSINVALGEVFYERNCLEEAERQIRGGLQANEPWVDIMSDALGLLALVRVLQAKGDHAGAMQIVEKFETRLQGNFRPHEFDEDFHTLRARTQLASGDLRSAAHWADEIQRSEDYRRHEERYRLTLARIRLAQGRYADVEEILAGRSTLPILPPSGNLIARQIESNFLLAAALAGQNRLLEAMGLVDASLALAEPEGYIRVFLDQGDKVRDLLAAYLREDAPVHGLYAQKVLDAFPVSSRAGSPAPHAAGLVEPLSGRELEVLCLMALGRTNQEIARQLVVAGGTVKAHAASIYRKLEAANRTEAVARARELGILS